MTTALARGVFGWSGYERRSDRYGAFLLAEMTYKGERCGKPFVNETALRALVGKRVRIRCLVVTARKSGHLGDLTHKIYPSQPDVGEMIDLGVGLFELQKLPEFEELQFILRPNDGRSVFWYDPYKFYRLHDQSVKVFIEETSDDFSTAPRLTSTNKDECINVGDGDVQIKTKEPDGTSFEIRPKLTRLGDGMFLMQFPGGKRGDRFKVHKK